LLGVLYVSYKKYGDPVKSQSLISSPCETTSYESIWTEYVLFGIIVNRTIWNPLPFCTAFSPSSLNWSLWSNDLKKSSRSLKSEGGRTDLCQLRVLF
jgi:hypothetical protein